MPHCTPRHTPPAPTTQAQEITRAQSYGLPKLGTVSAHSRGSPDDVQRAIAARANQSGAVYYQILMVDETTMPASGMPPPFCTARPQAAVARCSKRALRSSLSACAGREER